MIDKLLRRLRNRRKPTLGLVVGVAAYVVCVVVFQMDNEEASAIAGGVALFVVERVKPIFGSAATTPEG